MFINKEDINYLGECILHESAEGKLELFNQFYNQFEYFIYLYFKL
jgi:hypothetical protein